MSKKNSFNVVLGTAALTATAVIGGGAAYFYDMAIVRNCKNKLPHPPRIISDEDVREQRRLVREWYDAQGAETHIVRSFDGLKLVADYLPAKEPTVRTMLLVHGYRSTGLNDFGGMIRFYHELGYNILLVEDRGCGRSEGNYLGFGWQDHYDVMRWINYLVEKLGQDAEIILHGVSMGASTVMIAAGDVLPPQVKGIIADCGYTNAIDEFKWILKKQFKLNVSFPMIEAVRGITIALAGYDIKDCDAQKGVGRTKLPCLFIHGDSDEFVPTYMGKANYSSCASLQKRLVIIENAGHAESYYADREKYEKAVRGFLRAL